MSRGTRSIAEAGVPGEIGGPDVGERQGTADQYLASRRASDGDGHPVCTLFGTSLTANGCELQ